MSNTKKRKKLLWGAMMLMNDIRRCKGWHEPIRSYMRYSFHRKKRYYKNRKWRLFGKEA